MTTARPNYGAQATAYSLRCAALRPESEMVVQHLARKGKKGSTGQPDPVASRCPYPDVRRRNPRCEALGTMYHMRGASPGTGLGEEDKDEHPCRTD
jgi:hypothetical protein